MGKVVPGALTLACGLWVGLWGFSPALAEDPPQTLEVWPGFAPGESTADPGKILPRRPNENPPATRIGDITKPMLEIYSPEPKLHNGAAAMVLPGGGYNYVVQDKEGAEVARWLNSKGFTAFVLRYRTKDGSGKPLWVRPLQDAQRAMSLIRDKSEEWRIDPKRIGVVGFSAGGNAAALLSTRSKQRSYDKVDAVDEVSCRPDFSVLVYPWRLVDDKTGELSVDFTVDADTPPTFLVHAHDDGHSPISSVKYYLALKAQKVPAELHIFETGGHGFGLRMKDDTSATDWPVSAAAWLKGRGCMKQTP